MTDGGFVPEGFAPPTRLDTASFRLRPLTTAHNERDHAAWSGSLAHIRATPGFADGDWPHPMSLDDNRRDLQGHHDDFLAGRGFTYTVLAPDGPEGDAEVLGCAYLYPEDQPGSDVHVRSWVTADNAHLDALVAAEVRSWLEGTDWPWEPGRIRDHPRPTTA